jgi:hypothetical protein
MSIPVSEAGLLHKFALQNRCISKPDSQISWEIDQCLDLGVGGDGIIGRRISIYEDAMLRRHVAEGIVGWN